MLSKNDLTILENKGISIETFNSQIARFKTGFPYLDIIGPATPDNGINVLDRQAEDAAVARWNTYLANGGEVIKMVPASGAASRMFKSLYNFVNSGEEKPEPGSDVDNLMHQIPELPFADQLDSKLLQLHGLTSAQLIEKGHYREIASAIVNENGLNFGNFPKGLLPFHRYPDGSVRTPLEEQMAEGAQTVCSGGVVHIHFTVSSDHREAFKKQIESAEPVLGKQYNVRFDISLSEQSPATDTVAVNPDNTPFRVNGNLLFRPGGHGALLRNLDALDSAVVFLKNIDNVVPDSNRQPTIHYKKVLGGVLLTIHDRITQYLGILDSGKYTMDDLREMIAFLHDTLNIRHPQMKLMDDSELALYIRKKLDRPLRVCGMVRNQGEPGGGPFITVNPDGSSSSQILETTQIDLSTKTGRDMLSHATHFNPVDLVCYTKRPDGSHYNLADHIDPATGFISSKSMQGRELRALELPGLWNGAMSDWSTVFIEVPLETFNPVKTINDLLRPAHLQ